MSGRTRFPFTPSQWQELEHQALIYKYMVSGLSIPPDLLFSIKRSCFSMSTDSPSNLFPPHIGWNCFQMGLGRKIDPEPGRCRRTDGKKWRCSKEAFADSKYCERHMHRGKNRSRKPVEVLKASPISTTTTSSSSSNPPSSIPTRNNLHHTANYSNAPFLYHPHHHSSMAPPLGIGFESNTSLLLDSGSYHHPQPNNSEYRYGYGLKEDVDEHAFFSEPSGTVRGFASSSSMEDSWQFTPLTMSTCTSSSSASKQSLQLQSNFTKMDRNEGTQKTIHRFFDEWPLKEKDSWLDLDDKSSNSGSVSTTRLSISIPNPAHDFPIFSSRKYHNGD